MWWVSGTLFFHAWKLYSLVTTWFTCHEFGQRFRSWNFVTSLLIISYLCFSKTPLPTQSVKNSNLDDKIETAPMCCSCSLRWLKIQYLTTCFSALEETWTTKRATFNFSTSPISALFIMKLPTLASYLPDLPGVPKYVVSQLWNVML